MACKDMGQRMAMEKKNKSKKKKKGQTITQIKM